jgi:hypothetical protein
MTADENHAGCAPFPEVSMSAPEKNRRTILTAAKHPGHDEKIEKPF